MTLGGHLPHHHGTLSPISAVALKPIPGTYPAPLTDTLTYPNLHTILHIQTYTPSHPHLHTHTHTHPYTLSFTNTHTTSYLETSTPSDLHIHTHTPSQLHLIR